MWVSEDPGSILWRAFFFFFCPLFSSPSPFQLEFKSWHGFNTYQILIFFSITLFLFFPSFFPLLHLFFCPPLLFLPPLFPCLPSFFSFSYFFPIHFLSFSSSCFLFYFPICCFSFSLSSLFFILLISSSFSPPLSFSFFCFFVSRQNRILSRKQILTYIGRVGPRKLITVLE